MDTPLEFLSNHQKMQMELNFGLKILRDLISKKNHR
ncbi:hypothetical protein SAMN05421820_101523 [Pedobacter steynii]|uniref:Uncharacterized protein n=1 Tax=Pedobacter steynii TaxID=430522 RepID=A0A1G9KC53_9SPHI|nr:hypothetical protein SAMN05421820_101523 [Pedobacter steynii]